MVLPNIPRITIAAFCETQDCADFLAEVSRDPSMARTSMEIKDGGLVGAVTFYKSGGQKTPSLIILEVPDATSETLNTLDSLADLCDSETKVIVIGHKNDVRLYRELIERGVSDYIAAPDDISDIVHSIARIFSPQTYKASGNLITVLGARGGVGSSTIAHNIAWLIASRLNQPTILGDFDLNFGTAALDFNKDASYSIRNALFPESKLDSTMLERLLVKTDNALSLLVSAAALDHTMDLSENAFDEIVGFLRSLSPYVVLDLPHVWTSWMKSILAMSNSIVLVAEPDLASLRNSKAFLDALKSLRGFQATPPIIVLNRMGMAKRPETMQPDFEETLTQTVEYVIDDDPEGFGSAANNGYVYTSGNPKSAATLTLVRLMHAITGTRMSDDAGQDLSIMKKLQGVFGLGKK
jgi:pilus assembly protein CpaE